ncbi:MAG: formylglycine-generating enzyme family protein, partial [Actinomycetia bacterium]|nr:formylglycine-generating enzyme family protein [Actinomycetes bacterium]
MCGKVPTPLIQLVEERTKVRLEHPVQHVPGTATPLDRRRHAARRQHIPGQPCTDRKATVYRCSHDLLPTTPVSRWRQSSVVSEHGEDALRWAPREAAGQQGKQGALIYGRDEHGHFRLVPDADGDLWELDWPVLNVDWYCATAYAAWHAARTGQPWRLPWDFEWEKAARGVDGRIFPWGDGIDPTYACFRDSHPGRPLPQLVDSFPLDVSPCGVRGLGGNVRDWCVDHWTK